jgi:hypothetical protein
MRSTSTKEYVMKNMAGFKPTIIASRILEDDRFKIGGQLFRVSEVVNNDYDQVVIRFYHIDEDKHTKYHMVVPKLMPIKIYNLHIKKK